jgi:hypothetical protein
MRQPRRSREQWAAIIAKQQSSGLTQTQFCREFHLNYATFCARKYDIDNNISSHDLKRDSQCVEHTSTTSSKLVKVTTRSNVTNNKLTIHHDNVVLHVPLPVEPEWVVAVLRGIQA